MNTPSASILIVDDFEDNLEILGDVLAFHGYIVHTARTGEAAIKRAQEAHPDLILLDVLMPGIDGFEVCTRLKAGETTKDIPVIFVSALTDIETKVEGFKVGGVDYINKPFQHAEILARVNTHITLLRLRQRLEEQNSELKRLANTDYLTNLFNRHYFFHAAQEELASADLQGVPVSITLIDLDYFKRINDTYGHLAGDSVLVHVARLIRANCREGDAAARYGGEEFIVLHPATDCQSAFKVAERMRREVEATPFLLEAKKIGVTFSAGVVDSQNCGNCARLDDLLALADNALYQAKTTGRNQVVIFEKSL